MAFRIYNIQLLPLDTKLNDDVGTAGYNKLFQTLKEKLEQAQKDKSLIDYSYTLEKNSYILPYKIEFRQKEFFIFGEFIKFHTAQSVQDLYTQKDLFVANDGSTAISNPHTIDFIFNTKSHRMAICESGGAIPSVRKMENALRKILKQIADEKFPDHTLTINLVSETKRLQDILDKAKAFGKIRIRLTYPNGSGATDVLQDMRDRNIHVLEQNLSPAKGAHITSPPTYTRDLLAAVADYGQAKLTYYTTVAKGKADALKRNIYETKNFPEKINIRKKKDETLDEYNARVAQKLLNQSK